jgi:AraC family transcriptional regulator of adaptative response / DNA-3-methyladenine glycosylase II
LIRLGVRRPFAADALMEFFAARAIPGVETVVGRRYVRGPLTLDVRDDGVDVTFDGDPRDADHLLARVRAMLDLDAEPRAIDGHLAADPYLAPLVAARPGVRSPGILDPAEALVRAIVGQQISVAAARTVLGRLPSPTALADADPEALPLPRARARALVGAMAAVAADPSILHDRERLARLPGVGAWTVEYVAMRLGDRDAFPAGDLHVRRAAVDAEPWRPYRAYALHHLWLAAR